MEIKIKLTFKRIYGFVAIIFFFLILFETQAKEIISNVTVLKIVDFSFWYFFGLFSGLLIIRRIINVNNERNH